MRTIASLATLVLALWIVQLIITTLRPITRPRDFDGEYLFQIVRVINDPRSDPLSVQSIKDRLIEHGERSNTRDLQVPAWNLTYEVVELCFCLPEPPYEPWLYLHLDLSRFAEPTNIEIPFKFASNK